MAINFQTSSLSTCLIMLEYFGAEDWIRFCYIIVIENYSSLFDFFGCPHLHDNTRFSFSIFLHCVKHVDGRSITV